MSGLGHLARSLFDAYVKDVVVRPQEVGGMARLYCRAVGKPLLHVGRGTLADDTVMRRLHRSVFGSQALGDVNLDLALAAHLPLIYRPPYPDRYFGAVLAPQILEYLDRPWDALCGWHRVADRLFVTTAEWRTAHAWLDPRRLWLITPDLRKAYPLWGRERHCRLLSPPPAHVVGSNRAPKGEGPRVPEGAPKAADPTAASAPDRAGRSRT